MCYVAQLVNARPCRIIVLKDDGSNLDVGSYLFFFEITRTIIVRVISKSDEREADLKIQARLHP